ncbi:MAG: hypothetical protein QUS08_01150 [Methanothrix sp.]|nr:hypothetical protein [Methanothrix sp.]
MKEYEGKRPVLVVGGTSQDFLGEYMAGGVVILLGLKGEAHRARFIGTGMHGGVIYLRGRIDGAQVGSGVEISGLDDSDRQVLDQQISDFLDRFPDHAADREELLGEEWTRLSPRSRRPYGKLYAY